MTSFETYVEEFNKQLFLTQSLSLTFPIKGKV